MEFVSPPSIQQPEPLPVTTAQGLFYSGINMPLAAPKPCNHPGCGVLVRDGSSRCMAHKRIEARAHDEARGSSSERGYTAAWQRARAAYLRAHPLCKRGSEIKAAVVAATVVDHIKPHKGDKTLFWDSTNWQPLCKPCHDHKTATEDGGGWQSRARVGG